MATVHKVNVVETVGGGGGGGASSATIEAHALNLGASASWTPASVPAGTLVGVSMVVLAGTGGLTDQDSTALTLLPVGFSAEWSAPPDGTLDPPLTITSDAASRVVVTMTVRA